MVTKIALIVNNISLFVFEDQRQSFYSFSVSYAPLTMHHHLVVWVMWLLLLFFDEKHSVVYLAYHY